MSLPGIDTLRPFHLAALLVLAGLLLAPAPLLGKERAPPPAVDSLQAADVAFHFRYAAPLPPAGPPPRDRWIARDKARHVVFSGLWTVSSQYVLVNKADWAERDALPLSIASSVTVGLAKELYDGSRPTGIISGKDLVADAVGISVAVGLILL